MNAIKNQKFIIQPHFRLHEWVAEEKGYFAAEGLDYMQTFMDEAVEEGIEAVTVVADAAGAQAEADPDLHPGRR